jgi:hypothetical protein
VNRFRRFLKLAWVAQLAFVVLASPAAHVHRHGAGGCASGTCASDGATACSTDAAHVHGDGCSHDHDGAGSAKVAVALVAGETTIQAPTDGSGVDHHCAACALQRLIGQGFSPAYTLLLQESPSLSAPRLVSTCCGRDVEVRGCRGPPLGC